MTKTKIQIKTYWGSVLFEYSKKDNTLKQTLEQAVSEGANLRGADLIGANLTDADLREIQAITQIIPETGSFEAWKKGENGHLIKLEIPSKAKRHNYIGGRKCRAEFVKVLDIRNSKGHKVKECYNGPHGIKTTYHVGDIVTPDSYDPDPFAECSHGIHFFVTKQEAKDW